MKDSKKQIIYTAIGILVILAIVLIYFQVTKEVETTDTGEELETCGEGTIIYTDEDLCWQRSVSPNKAANWQAASDYCDGLVLGGEDDWYLPTRDELKTIIDKSVEEVAINTDYFKDTTAVNYWTSSEYRAGIHWYIHFELGYEGFAPDFNPNYGIRCVRENTLF